MRYRLRLTASALLLTLTACSINLTEAPPPTSTRPATALPTDAPDAPPTPTVAASPTPPPPQWANLNLTGRLIFNQPKSGLSQLDLVTGELTTIFSLPAEGWITSAALAADGQTLVMAYAPPPPPDQVQLGYTDLYLFALDETEPEILLARSEPQESFFSPLWSPEGDYIYFAHFKPLREENGTPPPIPYLYTIERLAYPPGESVPEVLVTNAFWPALSPDGSMLAFVGSDPETFLNDLYVSKADGSELTKIVPPDSFDAVDAPFFSPDGSAVVFSAVGEGPKALTLFDRLLGVAPVFAAPLEHNVPSDWWRIPIEGGQPTRLTRIYNTSLFGDYAPDGGHIAFISATGLYVMSPEGGNVFPLMGLQAFGSVEWVP
jgi:Tol biopolymer transport system component